MLMYYLLAKPVLLLVVVGGFKHDKNASSVNLKPKQLEIYFMQASTCNANSNTSHSNIIPANKNNGNSNYPISGK